MHREQYGEGKKDKNTATGDKDVRNIKISVKSKKQSQFTLIRVTRCVRVADVWEKSYASWSQAV
jgi:hypothetical protein